MPAPPARMRSANVPCGDSSTFTWPFMYSSARSGLPPTKLQITRETWRVFSSTASPCPALPQLLLMIVRFLTRLRAMASMHASALPHSPNPPDMIDMPSWSRPARALSTFGNTFSIGGEV